MIDIDEQNKMIKGSATVKDIKAKGLIKASIGEQSYSKDALKHLEDMKEAFAIKDRVEEEIVYRFGSPNIDIFDYLDIKRCDRK